MFALVLITIVTSFVSISNSAMQTMLVGGIIGHLVVHSDIGVIPTGVKFCSGVCALGYIALYFHSLKLVILHTKVNNDSLSFFDVHGQSRSSLLS